MVGTEWTVNEANVLKVFYSHFLREMVGNLINEKRISSYVIISLILSTISIDDVWIMLGENSC